MKTKRHILHIALGLILSATAAFAHSDAFEPTFVDTLVAPYLSMQKSLAGDDLAAAKTGAETFLEAMKVAPHENGTHQETDALSAPAEAITHAADIQTARASFRTLSHEIISLVEHVGTTAGHSLYVAHCPMAFSNTGADWMQSNKTVANPYYGAMMLRCGDIKKQIAGEELESEKAHGGHEAMPVPSDPHAQARLDALHAGVPGYQKVKITAKQSATPAQKMSCCSQ